ncbi:hypothetical protein OUZ56_019351 [Daphnia magna]|uniref:Uncharacterized protein n=1 Tax=Daphnia magna TaxID=35525 RepID=A0ABQ9ZBC1_9CRUS|nr:hypothetical protein OUZ56_019351 [Daphnia magna]
MFAFRFNHSFGYSLTPRNLKFLITNLKGTLFHDTRLFEGLFSLDIDSHLNGTVQYISMLFLSVFI